VSFTPIQFGKYKLIQPLAQGGMAEIFLAKQQGPAGYEKTVVIKRVLSHYSAHPDFVAMFLDEARLAAQLSHPNIVQIFDFGEAEGSYYLCMEYLRGEDLNTIAKLAQRKGVAISAQVAAIVVAAACDALHYAHTLRSDDGEPLNIVHRDISPSNLFITYQGVVKVLDFGIARAEGKVVKTATGMIKGKLSYMAPEQAKGGDLDGRADVWALGTVLQELLTGKRLFWRGNDVESFRALLDEPIPLPSETNPNVPRELDEICVRALMRNPADRFDSAREMYAELDDFLSSRTYVPSQTLLQSFMQELVGQEVIEGKLKSGVSKAAKSGSHQSTPPAPEETRAAPATASMRRSAVAEPRREPLRPAPAAAARRESPTSAAARPAPIASPPPRPTSRIGLISAGAAAGLVLFAAVAVLLPKRQPEEPAPKPVVAEMVREDERPVVDEPVRAQPPEVKPVPVAVETKPVEPKPTRGQLDVNCVPWCRIFIDGKDTGKVSPALGITLPAGKHRLRVVNTPTGVEQEKEIVIRAGATTREVVKF